MNKLAATIYQAFVDTGVLSPATGTVIAPAFERKFVKEKTGAKPVVTRSVGMKKDVKTEFSGDVFQIRSALIYHFEMSRHNVPGITSLIASVQRSVARERARNPNIGRMYDCRVLIGGTTRTIRRLVDLRKKMATEFQTGDFSQIYMVRSRVFANHLNTLRRYTTNLHESWKMSNLESAKVWQEVLTAVIKMHLRDLKDLHRERRGVLSAAPKAA